MSMTVLETLATEQGEFTLGLARNEHADIMLSMLIETAEVMEQQGLNSGNHRSLVSSLCSNIWLNGKYSF